MTLLPTLAALCLAAALARPQSDLERDPRFAEAQKLFQAGDFENGMRLFQAMCEDGPKDGSRALALAQFLVSKGQYPVAVPFARLALEQGRTDPGTHVLLGACLLESGEKEAAAKVYESAVERYPKNGSLWFSLGITTLECGRVLDAHECYRKAVELEPARSLFQFALGESWLRRSQYEPAERCFQAATLAQSPFADARWRWAQSLAFLGRKEEAEKEFLEAVKEGEARKHPAAALEAYGTFLLDEQRFADARVRAARLVEFDAEHRAGWLILGRAQRALGETEAAKASMQRYRELQKQENAAEDRRLLRAIEERALQRGEGNEAGGSGDGGGGSPTSGNR